MKKSIPALSLFFILQLTVFSSFSYAQTWAWAKSAGGAQKVEAYAIATDNAGNSYITGWFEDTLKIGTITLVAPVTNNLFASDVFLAKYDVNGNLIWAKRAGGTSYDYGNGITLDTLGNVYVVGLFSVTATFGTHTVTSAGDYDVFIAKYDPSGTCLWVNKGGGSGWDVGSGVNIDKVGNCYITGAFRNTATFGTSSLTSAGNYDSFVAKYDPTGTFMWARGSGGPGDDRGLGLSTDGVSNCYVTGFFNNTINIGTSTLTSAGNSDIFLAKYDAIGNSVWAKREGGDSSDVGNSIISDAAGTMHVTGYFGYAALFGSGLDTVTLISYGNDDIFVGKFDYKGDVVWVKKMGGSQNDRGYAITTDSFGNSYVAGSFFNSAMFDTIPMSSYNQDDAFVAGLDFYGKTKKVIKGGGLNPDVARGISTNSSGSCFTTGYFSGTAYFCTADTVTGVSFSDNALFVARVDSVFINNLPNTGIYEDGLRMKELLAYPNPSNSDITFQFETSATDKQISVELYDLLGKAVTGNAVISETRTSYNKKQITINRGNLPDGLYFGKVIAGDQIYTTRLMLINP